MKTIPAILAFCLLLIGVALQFAIVNSLEKELTECQDLIKQDKHNEWWKR